MPIYEYICQDCSHVWDELRKISDPNPEACPKCAKAHVEQRMTAAGFRLKGGGWYETDFKRDGDTKRNLVESSSTETTATAAAPTPATDTKPAATAESPAPATKSVDPP